MEESRGCEPGSQRGMESARCSGIVRLARGREIFATRWGFKEPGPVEDMVSSELLFLSSFKKGPDPRRAKARYYTPPGAGGAMRNYLRSGSLMSAGSGGRFGNITARERQIETIDKLARKARMTRSVLWVAARSSFGRWDDAHTSESMYGAPI